MCPGNPTWPSSHRSTPRMKPSVGYKYQVLQPVLEGSRKISRQSGRPTDPFENAGGSRDTTTTQASSKVGMAAMTGCKRSVTNDTPGSLDRRQNPAHLASAADFSPMHFKEPQSDGLLGAWLEAAPQNRHNVVAEEVGNQDDGGDPTSPMAVDLNPVFKGTGKAITTPNLTPISHNPLLHESTRVKTHMFSPEKHQSDTYYTCDPNAAWLAAEGLMPLADSFRAAGFVPAQIGGGVSYKVHSPKSQHASAEALSLGKKLFVEYMGDPHNQDHIISMTSTHMGSHKATQAHMYTPCMHTFQASAQTVHTHAATPTHNDQAEKHAYSKTQTTPHLCKLAQGSRPMHSIAQTPADASSTQASNQTPTSHPMLHAEILAALSSALGLGSMTQMTQMTSSGAPQPARKYFSQMITNAMSKLPITIIKELKGGFKNYIPLALCTHKACANATRATETLDTEVGFNEKGEMRLKQRYFSAVRDHYLTTDNFTKIHENFIWGMRKYLVLGDDSEPGGGMASDCADMFQEFFSVIAARLDFTLDWPYRGYIIETYTSWVSWRDDLFGLIFNKGLFYKYKMSNFGPLIVEQMKHVGSMLNNRGSSGSTGSSSFAGGNSFVGGSGFAGGGFMGSSGYARAQGRGHG
ncbi:hypothetical protein L208DRAFT_1401928, partial [Tricholoma matsutake]